MGLWAGESGICLSSTGSLHRPRGGLHPPCHLPLLPPSRSPRGGSPTHVRTHHIRGYGQGHRGAPLPTASVFTAAPAYVMRSAVYPPCFVHSYATFASCQLASSRSHASVGFTSVLHRTAILPPSSGGNFCLSQSRARVAVALAAISTTWKRVRCR